MAHKKPKEIELEETNFIKHMPCGNCGSSDANSLYSDGHTYCYSCNKREKDVDSTTDVGFNLADSTTIMEEALLCEAMEEEESPVDSKGALHGVHRALTSRGLTLGTCKKFDYMVGKNKLNQPVHIANYYNEGGDFKYQKTRTQDKKFMVLGKPSKVTLFGMQLWQKGKTLIITEGEIDAMSVSQIQYHKYPVVSLPNGAQGAVKALKDNLTYFDNFSTIYLMFDMDDHGKASAKACAELLPVGKVKIVSLPLKDANECLLAGQSKELIKAFWDAKEFRPDGLIDVSDLMEEVLQEVEVGLPWFHHGLTQVTYGRRMGEIYALGAGTGVGKTDFITQQIAYDVVTLKEPVGLFFLEQKPAETIKRIAGKVAGKRFHVPDGSWKPEELVETLKSLQGKITLYDNFGSTDWEIIKSKIRYMAIAQKVKLFYLDHLTALADPADERGSLELIMQELSMLANELSICITFVSHLATPAGAPHEEGGRVTIRHFKGSRAIGFWSYFMIGLERDQQAKILTDRQETTVRVLKDRFTGTALGRTFKLGFNSDKGLLYQKPVEEEGEPDSKTPKEPKDYGF